MWNQKHTRKFETLVVVVGFIREDFNDIEWITLHVQFHSEEGIRSSKQGLMFRLLFRTILRNFIN